MNEKELNYLLTNFACDHIEQLIVWLKEKGCDRQFTHDVVDGALELSISNAQKESEIYDFINCIKTELNKNYETKNV